MKGLPHTSSTALWRILAPFSLSPLIRPSLYLSLARSPPSSPAPAYSETASTHKYPLNLLEREKERKREKDTHRECDKVTRIVLKSLPYTSNAKSFICPFSLSSCVSPSATSTVSLSLSHRNSLLSPSLVKVTITLQSSALESSERHSAGNLHVQVSPLRSR